MKEKSLTAAEIIQWDIRTWNKALSYWEHEVNWTEVHTALELGAREGGLSGWLADKEIAVCCSDYSNAEKQATPLHAKHHFSGSIRYEDIDATSIPYSEQFDLIVFKSIIGGIAQGDHIERQKAVFDQIYKALKPGGVLLFAENLSGSRFHRFFRNRFTKWSGYWRYISLDELNDFLSPFSDKKIKTTGFLATFGRSEKQKKALSILDDLGPNCLPKKWRYMVYGIAKK